MSQHHNGIEPHSRPKCVRYRPQQRQVAIVRPAGQVQPVEVQHNVGLAVLGEPFCLCLPERERRPKGSETSGSSGTT